MSVARGWAVGPAEFTGIIIDSLAAAVVKALSNALPALHNFLNRYPA